MEYTMEQKKFYIYQLADFLVAHDKTMSIGELADHLNRNGFRAEIGNKFVAGKGLGNLVGAAYDFIKDAVAEEEARKVADAYVDRNGEPAHVVADRKRAA
jgi:hypothetical protein